MTRATIVALALLLSGAAMQVRRAEVDEWGQS
jgi:hypothetical protein